MSARTAHRFACTLSSAAASACNYEEIRDGVVSKIVDAHRRADPGCTVTCNVFAGVGKLIVTGDTCCAAPVDVEAAVRAALRAVSRAERFAAPPAVAEEYVPEYVI